MLASARFGVVKPPPQPPPFFLVFTCDIQAELSACPPRPPYHHNTGADGLNPRYAPLGLLPSSVPLSTTLSFTLFVLPLPSYVSGRIPVTRHTTAVCLLLVQTLSPSRRRRSGLALKPRQPPSIAPQHNQISTRRLLTCPKFTNPNGFRTITAEPENLAPRPPR